MSSSDAKVRISPVNLSVKWSTKPHTPWLTSVQNEASSVASIVGITLASVAISSVSTGSSWSTISNGNCYPFFRGAFYAQQKETSEAREGRTRARTNGERKRRRYRENILKLLNERVSNDRDYLYAQLQFMRVGCCTSLVVVEQHSRERR